MMKDEAIEEIHRIREEIAEKYNFDIRKYGEHLKEMEKEEQDRLLKNEYYQA